jgi:hypothetical protein
MDFGSGEVNSDRRCEGGSAAYALGLEVGEHPLFFLGDVNETDEVVFGDVFHRYPLLEGLSIMASRDSRQLKPDLPFLWGKQGKEKGIEGDGNQGAADNDIIGNIGQKAKKGCLFCEDEREFADLGKCQ